jgi:iron complex outermembrane receptor protein
MYTKTRTGLAAALLASTVLGGISSAVAQDGEASSSLDVITITAQKREQSVQDVGMTVSVLGGQDMRDQGIDNVSDMAASLPNVSMFDVSGGGLPVVIIRGVGLQDFRANNTPTAAFYVDEVYQASVAAAAATMFDLDHVEVLRGPQGGLYGRNTTAGAIQVISAQPDTEATSGHGRIGYGDWGTVELEGAANLPVSDTLAFRFSGRSVSSGDTYFRSVTSGEEHGEQDRWAGRAQMLWLPNDETEIRFKVHAGADTSETPLLRAIPIWEPLGGTIVPNYANGALFNYAGVAPGAAAICQSFFAGSRDDGRCQTIDGTSNAAQGLADGDIHGSASTFANSLDNNWWGATVTAIRDVGDYSFWSITAYDTMDHGRLVDFDGIALTQQQIDYRSDLTAWSQEFRLLYSGDQLNWVIGANYAEDELAEDTELVGTSGLVPLAFGGLTTADQVYVQSTESWAAYGHAEFAASDAVNLIGELRVTSETKSFAGGVSLPQAGGVFIAQTDDEAEFENVSGRLGIEIAASDNVMFYGNLARGFKSGGFFGGFVTSSAALIPYDEETITSYEIGFKSDLFDNSLRLNGAAFYYDYQDFQANAREQTGIGASVSRLTNVGDVEVSGFEVDATWLPAAGWTIQAGLGYSDGEIASSSHTTEDIFSLTSHSLQGVNLPNSSNWSSNLIAAWEHQLDSHVLTLQGEAAYRSEHDLNFIVYDPETILFREEGYTLANFRAVLAAPDESWALQVFVENAFNQEYRTVARSDGLGGAYEIYGRPRFWGTALTLDW